jgi:hypothetical protein
MWRQLRARRGVRGRPLPAGHVHQLHLQRQRGMPRRAVRCAHVRGSAVPAGAGVRCRHLPAAPVHRPGLRRWPGVRGRPVPAGALRGAVLSPGAGVRQRHVPAGAVLGPALRTRPGMRGRSVRGQRVRGHHLSSGKAVRRRPLHPLRSGLLREGWRLCPSASQRRGMHRGHAVLQRPMRGWRVLRVGLRGGLPDVQRHAGLLHAPARGTGGPDVRRLCLRRGRL